ncbi:MULTISPECIES: DUF5983 family protein [unclassified Sphingobium]|uniref:DUF5983 family protein n=1 Tax=unclassified Sphingobium TaxID=2611147 RepID=UPI0007702C96|nr:MULTISPECIES: hypothetical protein [Sphingomonadaceae]AMK25247.1 hypothetical protein K426_21699 [Sphingobium sp. TKS]NML87903.1 hypothetical protein [Sphingobium sp. TB-6]
MRRTTIFVCSTAHLPVAEREEIDRIIANSPRNAGGRIEVAHPDLIIEPHGYGFFVHTEVVMRGDERTSHISPEFWAILTAAFESDASWILFDRDEPSMPDLPVFPDP